ncbi:hypothetical protein O181_026630 [Austropuccinia psidii MF-1]|uniref:Uncharacterized protein n=1 Tax=Austropuccinia psidii MF-1 TaxID=1389203 RepID=A0A9Q3CPM6_9BASI|nr:hypothetical protein [Austropuccinia psidii MF-1]
MLVFGTQKERNPWKKRLAMVEEPKIKQYSNGTCIWKEIMSSENDKYSVDKDPYELCLKKSKRLKAINPHMKIQMSNHQLLTKITGKREHEVKCRCNHSCTLDDIDNTLQEVRKRKNIDHYSNNFPKGKKKIYAFEKVPKEEIQEEYSEPDSMSDATRENADDDQDTIEEFMGN